MRRVLTFLWLIVSFVSCILARSHDIPPPRRLVDANRKLSHYDATPRRWERLEAAAGMAKNIRRRSARPINDTNDILNPETSSSSSILAQISSSTVESPLSSSSGVGVDGFDQSSDANGGSPTFILSGPISSGPPNLPLSVSSAPTSLPVESASSLSSLMSSTAGISATSSGSGMSSASSSTSASGIPSGIANNSLLDNGVPGWHFPYEALWNGSAPSMFDIVQDRIANCWLPAASFAITYISPNWVSNLLFWPDGSPMTGASFPTSDTVIVKLWNPFNGFQYNFTNINIYNESTTEDHPGGVWWHSALTQAQQMMAQINPIEGFNTDGSFNQANGSSAYTMAMLTGKPVTSWQVTNPATPELLDQYYSIMSNGTFSPVVISTIADDAIQPSVPPIVGDHSYAVFNVTNNGGNRSVTARNPWGATDTFQLEDIYANTFEVNYLTNRDTLVWGT